MASVIFEQQLRVPLGSASLDDFRTWVRSDDFPQNGRIDYIEGDVEVDMSPEDLFTHGTLKGKVCSVLLSLVEETDRGYLFVDRTRVSCPAADVSVEPDIVFLSHERLDDGRVHLVPKASGKSGEYIEIEGPPDLIVEIVSDSSVAKDTRRLPQRYFLAGVGEFGDVDFMFAALEEIRKGTERGRLYAQGTARVGEPCLTGSAPSPTQFAATGQPVSVCHQ